MFAKIGGAIFVVFSIVSIILWLEYEKALYEPVISGKPKLIEIKKGDSFNKITDKLIQQNIAIKPLWFKLIAYQKKVSNKLKTGEYELQSGLTMPDILSKLVEGKSLQYSITFPEGWSFKQIFQEIKNNPYINHTLEKNDYKSIMMKLSSDYEHPEGLFFPDTYFFEKNATDLSLLQKSHTKMLSVLNTEWEKREKGGPLENAYQALILASIVEKETGAAEEREKIAGVFTRRLETGMLLQTDPTVIYGMGDEYKGNIRYKDLRKPTPYNTYVIKGLPPTPIAMPGKEAIYAALHPAKGKSVYFVAKGNGTHIFSETLREHNNAVNKYQRKK
ncbi:MAG: endolytic transglycosylase MltG [Methylococcaceae bacterium]